MAEDKEKDKDLWKSIIEKVKKERKPMNEKSIEISNEEPQRVSPKEIIQKPESIEKISIEKSIEIPKEKSIEKIPEKEEVKEIPKQVVKSIEKSKFTTIMITKELKERLAKEKNPKESFGKLIERLLER